MAVADTVVAAIMAVADTVVEVVTDTNYKKKNRFIWRFSFFVFIQPMYSETSKRKPGVVRFLPREREGRGFTNYGTTANQA
jgi:hypothetical protein